MLWTATKRVILLYFRKLIPYFLIQLRSGKENYDDFHN